MLKTIELYTLNEKFVFCELYLNKTVSKKKKKPGSVPHYSQNDPLSCEPLLKILPCESCFLLETNPNPSTVLQGRHGLDASVRPLFTPHIPPPPPSNCTGVSLPHPLPSQGLFMSQSRPRHLSHTIPLPSLSPNLSSDCSTTISALRGVPVLWEKLTSFLVGLS